MSFENLANSLNINLKVISNGHEIWVYLTGMIRDYIKQTFDYMSKIFDAENVPFLVYHAFTRVPHGIEFEMYSS